MKMQEKLLLFLILHSYIVSKGVCAKEILKNEGLERNNSDVVRENRGCCSSFQIQLLNLMMNVFLVLKYITNGFQEKDRRCWDVYIPTNDTLQSTEAASTTSITRNSSNTEGPPVDPCTPYDPTPPDYRAPERRISEAKCLEYIWQLKLREIIVNRRLGCEYNRLKKEFPGQDFILKGYDAMPGEYPHMGAIGWKAVFGTWVFMCGSTLISSNFVLTAAHCTKAADLNTNIADPVPQIVRLGDKNILDVELKDFKPNDMNIVKSIVHPRYDPPRMYYDIALMQLAERVNFNRLVQPACLWTKFDTSSLGTQATITGWGSIESGSKTTSPNLQAAVVDIIDTPTCDNLLRFACNRLWCGVQDHQICAGKLTGGADACQGDSGGPLQTRIDIGNSDIEGAMYYVLGVTSFGSGCGRVNTPGMYTRVSSFVDWIEDIVWS